MNEKVKQLLENNTQEINALKEQYKGIGALCHELNYEIFEVLDGIDESKDKELFEHMIKISRMVDILEDRLRNKNGEMIERCTVEYILQKVELGLLTSSLSTMYCNDNTKALISKNDVKKVIKDTLEEMNYIA